MGHFRPISLVIVLATIYALMYHLTNVNLLNSTNNTSVEVYNYLIEHYYWFIIATIPLFAISTKLVFRRQDFNFPEYIIFESFKASQRLIVHTIFLPMIFIVNQPNFTKFCINFLFFIDISLIIWTNIQFFRTMPISKVIIKSILSYIIWFILVVIFLGVILLILGIDL